MSKVVSPHAVHQLDDLRLTVAPANPYQFNVCENGTFLALDRICTRRVASLPGNVSVADEPSSRTFPTISDPTDPQQPFPGSGFLTVSRMETQFIEIADAREASGRRVLVLAFDYV